MYHSKQKRHTFQGHPKVSKITLRLTISKGCTLGKKNFAQTGASVIGRICATCVSRFVHRAHPGSRWARVPDPDRPCGSTWTDRQRPINQVGNANRKVFALIENFLHLWKVFALVESFYRIPWNCTWKFLRKSPHGLKNSVLEGKFLVDLESFLWLGKFPYGLDWILSWCFGKCPDDP